MEALAYTYRGNLVDFVHYGDIAVTDKEGKLIYKVGDSERMAFSRSSAKPLQMIPVIESGAIKHFGISDKEIAVMCSSHNGEPEHVETIRGILKKIGLEEKHLQCGDHYPMAPGLEMEMKKAGRPPSPIFHPCSGKHCGMLMTALMYKEPIDTYPDPDHPVQQRILSILSEVCELPKDAIEIGVDGCGVPVHATPLSRFAVGFGKLAYPETSPYKATYETIARALKAHPFMIGGTGRICTALNEATDGNLLIKDGADGYFAMAVLDKQWGVTFKLNEAGFALFNIVVVELVKQLGLLTEEQEKMLSSLLEYEVRNDPGDIAAVRKPAFTLEKL